MDTIAAASTHGQEASCFHGHRHAGLIHSMPFLAAAVIIRFISSSVMGGMLLDTHRLSHQRAESGLLKMMVARKCFLKPFTPHDME